MRLAAPDRGQLKDLDSSPGMLVENGEYLNGRSVGHPITRWPGWVDNDARYSVQTDIIPIPVSPVHFQQWPGMQYQLSNGWQYTNYGQRAPYDTYRRMLYSSTSSPRAPAPMPGEGLQPFQKSMVSQKTIQNTVLVNREPDNSGGAGVLNAPLGRRTYYG